MSRSYAVQDTLDLRNEIKKLRIAKQELEEQKLVLLKQIEEKEKVLMPLKQEKALLAPDEELRWNSISLEDDSISTSSFAFRMFEEKLEMQILTEEIRAALPRLEEEAKAMERQSFAALSHIKVPRKMVLAHGSIKNSFIAKSADELRDMIHDIMERTRSVKERTEESVREKKMKNEEAVSTISSLRKEITNLHRERFLLRKSRVRYRNQQQQLAAQLQFVKDEITAMRCKLEALGSSWRAELFDQFKDLATNRIRVQDIPKALEKWIVSEPGVDWTREDFIREQLDVVLRNNASEAASKVKGEAGQVAEVLNDEYFEDELIVIRGPEPDADHSSLSTPALRADCSEIDFDALDKLCDRLIFVLETPTK